MTVISKKDQWVKKKKRLSYKVNMKAKCPSLVIFRSNKNICLQILDNVTNNTICSSSSLDKIVSKEISKAKNKLNMSEIVATHLAKKLKKKG